MGFEGQQQGFQMPACLDFGPMAHFTTWTALLAHWTDMARLARAIDHSDGADPGPLSLALPHIITCQALIHALPEVLSLSEAERSAAIDLAAAMLTRVDAACESTFNAVPEVLSDTRREAEFALDDLRLQCCWTLIWDGDVPLIVPEPPDGVPARGDEGTLLLALPGSVLLPGTPVGWWTNRVEPMLGHFVPGLRARPLLDGVQLWRVVDADGLWCRDVVLDLDQDPPDNATPLLVPRVVGGLRLEMPNPVHGWIGGAQPPLGGVPVKWPEQADTEER